VLRQEAVEVGFRFSPPLFGLVNLLPALLDFFAPAGEDGFIFLQGLAGPFHVLVQVLLLFPRMLLIKVSLSDLVTSIKNYEWF
jgi:hypothetical protein